MKEKFANTLNASEVTDESKLQFIESVISKTINLRYILELNAEMCYYELGGARVSPLIHLYWK